jgi:hypothetical protein
MTWTPAKGTTSPFDVDGYGRIDLADVAWLLTTGNQSPHSGRSFAVLKPFRASDMNSLHAAIARGANREGGGGRGSGFNRE